MVSRGSDGTCALCPLFSGVPALASWTTCHRHASIMCHRPKLIVEHDAAVVAVMNVSPAFPDTPFARRLHPGIARVCCCAAR
jgi:hypothetical protein